VTATDGDPEVVVIAPTAALDRTDDGDHVVVHIAPTAAFDRTDDGER
jgi:hypothetical protein